MTGRTTSSTPNADRALWALRRAALLFPCLFAAGCGTTGAVLKDAILASCGTSTIFLTDWWARVPVQQAVENDPMGGYQLLYWIDNAGNVCHGDPGRNGQVGPAVVVAQKAKARDAAVAQAVVTPARLKDFQEIPVPVKNYSAVGLHFAQFDNTIWRTRADGKTFKDNGSGVVSVPTIIEVGSNACSTPVALKVSPAMFVPNSLASTGQDPARCKVRAKPSGATMTDTELAAVDIFALPHGTELFNVP